MQTEEWLPFESLMEALRRRGFTVGTDHYLRLYRLLEVMGPACTGPKQLGDLLCPIFATSGDQQQAFQQVFTGWLEQAGAEAVPLDWKAPPVLPHLWSGMPWWRKPWSLAAAAVLLCLAVAWLASQASQKIPSPLPVVPGAKDIKLSPITAQVEVTDRQVEPEPEWMQKWRRNRPAFWASAAFLLGAWVLLEIWRWRKRRLILQRGRRRSAHAADELRLHPNPQPLLLGGQPDLREGSRRFRERVAGTVLRLDLAETVLATVAGGDEPSFRYRAERREPEYVVLMDDRGDRDHQRILFAELVKILAGSGMVIYAYTYSGDPRFCRDARTRRPMRFPEMQRRYAEARLLLLGDGEGLCDPFTGRLLEWTEAFAVFEKRAIVTPHFDTARWGDRESQLSASFSLWPATVVGIRRLAREWTGELDRPTTASRGRWRSGQQWQVADEENLHALRAEFGESAFAWLCACAVYPELHWDLTLRLAKFAVPEVDPEANRLRLMSLDWFREGSIPDEWRWLLVRSMRPEQETAVRHEIFRMLEESPQSKSPQAATREVAMEFNRMWPDVKRLVPWARRTSPEDLTHDVVMLRSLDSLRRSPLDLVLPEFMGRLLHERGVSLLGLKTVVRFGLVLAGMGIVAIGGYRIESSIRSFVPKVTSTTRVIEGSWDVVVQNKGRPLREVYVSVPSGEFLMGCSPGATNCDSDEKPAHPVLLTKGFLMAQTETTNGNYRKYLAETGAAAGAVELKEPDDRPVSKVTWEQARAYCVFTGGRLPTEAEWEYAARGKTTTERYGPVDEIAWHSANSRGASHPVGGKQANGYGLFDMLGNVWEWTEDWYEENSYDRSTAVDPKGPANGSLKVVRGGSWGSYPGFARAPCRARVGPDYRSYGLGFRCVREVP